MLFRSGGVGGCAGNTGIPGIDGNAEKNSLASLAITDGSITPRQSAGTFASPASGAGMLTDPGSLVFMVLVHADVLEHAKCIFGQYCQRAVKGNQIRRNRTVVNAHKPHR